MLVLHKLDNVDDMTTLDLEDSEWAVTHAYNGFDTLEFEVPVSSKYYDGLQEECRVTFIGSRSRDMRFVVKNIDEHSHFVTVDCDIDLDEWKASIIQSFRTVNSTLETVIEKIIPVGWSKSGMEKFTKRTTVEKTEGEPIEAATPLEILDYVTEAYGCVFNFDNINRVIYAMKPDDEKATGEYISDELNLTSRPGFVGNSSSFATRLYAYGVKDDDGNPLTFASINGGKEYVEDFSYSDKVVCIGWSDERYTVKEDLLAAAKEKLADVSKPTRSYSCDVAQLNYNVWMYRVVVLLDTVRGIRVNHQVVEWKERAKPSLDEVTLSAVVPNIESLIKDASNVDDKIDQVKQETESAYTKAIETATKRITGSYGGYFKWVYDADGNPMELVNLGDSEDISKASKVWRWNKEGLGHSNSGYDGSYGLALLADGSINATMMTVGIIQGGNSYWNLNTGDLRLYGIFKASYTDTDTKTTQTISVIPDFEQVSVEDPTVKYHGPAITFESSDSYRSGYIIREVEKSGLSDASALSINGGEKASDSPGSYMRIGSYRNDSTQVLDAEVYAVARASYLDVSTNNAELKLKARKDGSQTRALLIANDVNGFVGVEAAIDTSYLYLGGALGTFSNGRGTIVTINWTSVLTADEFVTNRFNATVPTPAKYGRYIPHATVDAVLENSQYIICSVSHAAASGWSAWTATFPAAVVTNSNFDRAILWRSFQYLFYTFGILHM